MDVVAHAESAEKQIDAHTGEPVPVPIHGMTEDCPEIEDIPTRRGGV